MAVPNVCMIRITHDRFLCMTMQIMWVFTHHYLGFSGYNVMFKMQLNVASYEQIKNSQIQISEMETER